MTTITFEESIGIDKTKFKNIADFFSYIGSYFSENEDTVPLDIRKEALHAKNAPLSDFVDI